MAGWGFTADSEYQNELAGKLESAADKYDNKVTALYNEVDNMGSNWSGEDYDMFNSSTKAYKPALDDLSDGFRMFAEHYKKMATGTETLATECIDIIMNMTGDSSGVYANINGSNGGDGSNTTPSGDPNNTDTVPDGAAVGVGDPAATTEEQGYWAKLGQRYVDDWNDLKSDFTAAWEGTDGLFSGAWSCVETVLDGGAFVVSGAVDTVQGATDMVQSGWNWCFDLGDSRSVDNGSYWDNVGADFAENWDYSSCDGVGEYVGKFVCESLVGSVLDTVQLAGNAVVDVGNSLLEGADIIVEGATDILGTIGNWIFG